MTPSSRTSLSVCRLQTPSIHLVPFFGFHRHAVHRLYGGPVVGRTPFSLTSATTEFWPPLRCHLPQYNDDLSSTSTRTDRPSTVPASQCSTGEMIQCCSAHAVGPAVDAYLAASQRRSCKVNGASALPQSRTNAQQVTNGGHAECMVALSIFITLSGGTWGLAVQSKQPFITPASHLLDLIREGSEFGITTSLPSLNLVPSPSA
jgi:hypothetical protein